VRTIGITLLVLLAACGGNGLPTEILAVAYRDLGELEDAIDAQRGMPDSDGDSIPDAIEDELGSDPNNRDSDFDGLVDNYELFEPGYRRDDRLPDRDRDGLIASVDSDENDDRINDGEVIDTDGDGVANFLEYYGYTYDFLTGQFSLWDGNPDTPHYFTDPLQPSTDQDAYPDGMEVSGLFLDPTVRAPGNDPLVPAYPNLVVELASYSVTLNETIELTESESISQGRNWTRQTDRTHSYTNEINWGVGVTAGFEASAEPKVTGEVSANLGGSYSGTNSVSVSVGQGESITSDEGWSVARTSNPSEAARIKLFLKIHNRGTAPISNIVPTLTLKIGGLNVATFEPGNAQVNMLVPNATYPDEPGVFWVVDAVASGAPLSLTMTELRALERGAPISVSLTQVLGDSMRLTPEGTWESVGAAAEYIARCDAVCANLRIDLGDGELVHHLVYGDDSPSARAMSLGEALAKIGVDENGTLSYVDREGNPRTRSLDGFKYAIDPTTLRANGWTVDPDGTAAAPEDFALHAMRILPDTSILIRAPRDAGSTPEPEVHFGYLDPYSGEIKVSAADYEGILRVAIYNADRSQTVDLFEDVPGAGFFSGNAGTDDGFDAADTLQAEVTNLAGLTKTVELGQLYQAPGPQVPIINLVALNINDRRLYANVESGNPDNPNSLIEWVRVYHDDLPDGFLELDPVINYYEDPHGLEAQLPVGFQSTDDVKVVAYVSQDVWTEEIVSPEDITNVQVRRQGTITMKSEWDDGGLKFASRIGRLTLDAPKNDRYYRYTETTNWTGALHPIPGAPTDLVLRVNNNAALIPNMTSQMFFNAQHALVGQGDVLYRGLTKSEIQAETFVGDSPLEVGALGGLQKNEVYAIRTTAGLYAKIYVVDIVDEYYYFQRTRTWKVTLKFAVFEN
jgi:hypothetical protein